MARQWGERAVRRAVVGLVAVEATGNTAMLPLESKRPWSYQWRRRRGPHRLRCCAYARTFLASHGLSQQERELWSTRGDVSKLINLRVPEDAPSATHKPSWLISKPCKATITMAVPTGT